MSMMGYFAALSPAQIAAFEREPELVAHYAATASEGEAAAQRELALSRMPPEVRQQYEAARRQMLEQAPDLAAQQQREDAARPVLAALGPFAPLLELGKTWHILHYLLTGHTDAAAAPGDAILTGAPIGDDMGYGPARLHAPNETRQFRDILTPLDPGRLATRLDFAQMRRLRVYPLFGEPDAGDDQGWRDEALRAFADLKAYVAHAADRGEGLLTLIS